MTLIKTQKFHMFFRRNFEKPKQISSNCAPIIVLWEIMGNVTRDKVTDFFF